MYLAWTLESIRSSVFSTVLAQNQRTTATHSPPTFSDPWRHREVEVVRTFTLANSLVLTRHSYEREVSFESSGTIPIL